MEPGGYSRAWMQLLHVLCVLLFGLAISVGGLGIYVLAKTDVQGGADAAGAILLVIAVALATGAVAVVALVRRRS